ncbi:N-acetyl-gamma-glutamyl-phosphate reductase [Desulfonema limicola]|uniref:N-acetyl-gamma-glutamyl-phosphate reductase n=1 Tax=Desulfonema limicola TaxID=45656 RepID=A0A975BBF0_9BACT|nr:N-acetyl-gamma-glutamyl-phosphate reductase [Desulfonema limicola]QTA82187.1 N-acetyl-gamma-glutamyl-phosphate reductase [Desulfonema limicola]
MVRVGIVGATGYAGAELVRILYGHPQADLTIITSRQYAGKPVSSVYPAFKNVIDMVCQEFSINAVCEQADLIFTALPHKIPMEIVPEMVKNGKRVIDLSADFRFNDPEKYKAVYQPHTSEDLMKKAVYGLSEVYFNQIRTTDIVGNPGCYPTSVLLPLIPLIKAGIIDTDTIISDSKSGVSGAGRSPNIGSLYCEASESFKAYKAASHRHNPEMNEVLSCEAGKPVNITFVPHLVPMSRGMLTTTYAKLLQNQDTSEILDCLSRFYKDRPFVRVCPPGSVPSTIHVRGTNYCDIGAVIDKSNNRLILVSAIDNLVKGAAGQAVQNMNIMLEMDETLGLDSVPYPL